MPDPLNEIHGRSFVEGQDAIAKHLSARRAEEDAKRKVQALEVANEMIDRADKLAEGGDTYKQKLAKLIKDNIVDSMAAALDTVPGSDADGEAKEALLATPFSNGSPPSVANSIARSPSPIPLSHDSSEGGPKPKRRGRPPKNRPQG